MFLSDKVRPMKPKSPAKITKDALLRSLKPVKGVQTEGDRIRDCRQRLRRGDFTKEEVSFLNALEARQEKRNQLTHFRGVTWADVLLELHEVSGVSVQDLMLWPTSYIDELIDAALRRRSGSSQEERSGATQEEDACYGKALEIWNDNPKKTWREIVEIMGRDSEDVNAFRTGVRRFAKTNNLPMRKGSPGRRKKK